MLFMRRCGECTWDLTLLTNRNQKTPLTKKNNFNGNLRTLMHRIRQLLQLNWQVHLSHTWREGNRSVDWLANFNYTLSSFSVHFLESLPRELQSLIFEDIFGACMPRNNCLSL
jgi:hypothetical protein